MHKILVIILLSAFAITASSQKSENELGISSKSVICGPILKILEVLKDDDVNEQPIWRGMSDDNKSGFAVFVNNKTNAFTIIQYNKEFACVLGTGQKSEVFNKRIYNY